MLLAKRSALASFVAAAASTGSAASSSTQASDGCYPKFKVGTPYSAGARVSASATAITTSECTAETKGCANGQKTIATLVTRNYECVDGPNSAFCSMLGHEPAGIHSSLAWIELSACVVSLELFSTRFRSLYPSSCLIVFAATHYVHSPLRN